MNHQQLLKKAESLLSQKELEALKRLGENESNRLSPQAAAQFFALYLQGYNTVEIAQQNPSFGSLGLGLIARARVEYDWDLEREKYIKNLMDATRMTAEKATLESIQFLSDGMAAFHKLVGAKFRRYLQTGNQEDLGEFSVMSFKTYKDMVAMFQSHVNPEKGEQRVNLVVSQEKEEEAKDQLQTADDAASILDMLVKSNIQ